MDLNPLLPDQLALSMRIGCRQQHSARIPTSRIVGYSETIIARADRRCDVGHVLVNPFTGMWDLSKNQFPRNP
jgi:hypothetical protein